MKARRLILEEYSSTKSRAATSRERPTREAGTGRNTVRKKEASAGKRPLTSEVRSTPIEPSRATKKDKGKAVLTKEVPPKQDKVPSACIRMKISRNRTVEVLALLSDTKQDPAALEKAVARAVESVLQKRLAEEVEKQRYSEKACEDLCEDVERAKCVTVVLLSRLEACRVAYNAESLRVDELKEHEYETELAAKAKKLAYCEAAKISNLELMEKLETQCGELRSQRTQVEEQLGEVETRLAEAEEKSQ
ncbi:hypothetical protein AXG93_3052s1070 [Marchantia polymorpha subsp. ruderalis]|uniref:Uncharacterized protein n=1 Tax=Marchantia polymorpha subsp. ruderalis TaxID=1480154 RepID=A0A176WIC4_MARPO|nr:hypothetical protein AXG93_3052s1070 [Marchantia polymorpha subsp. ruderalis]